MNASHAYQTLLRLLDAGQVEMAIQSSFQSPLAELLQDPHQPQYARHLTQTALDDDRLYYQVFCYCSRLSYGAQEPSTRVVSTILQQLDLDQPEARSTEKKAARSAFFRYFNRLHCASLLQAAHSRSDRDWKDALEVCPLDMYRVTRLQRCQPCRPEVEQFWNRE